MKKTYSTPTALILKVRPQVMMTSSENALDSDGLMFRFNQSSLEEDNADNAV